MRPEVIKSFGVYGLPPVDLVAVEPGAIQFSPLLPGSQSLEDQAPASLSGMSLLAPPGTIERRYALALVLRALVPGAPFTALGPKDKGGSRLAKELRQFGCEIVEDSKRHHRICVGVCPRELQDIDAALAEGAPRFSEMLGFWSQPGVFSWDRIDPGSALLVEHLPPLAGCGADLGCGIGFLTRAIHQSKSVTQMTLVEVDRRAVDAARRNLPSARANVIWADLLHADLPVSGLDFVVTNPPFHDGGSEDRALGEGFLRRAADLLRVGGTLWLVANRHLPYEAVLKPLFRELRVVVENQRYKIFEARK